jgi:hypothetical protein
LIVKNVCAGLDAGCEVFVRTGFVLAGSGSGTEVLLLIGGSFARDVAAEVVAASNSMDSISST